MEVHMAAFNKRRVWLGTLAGGLVWNIFGMAIQFGVLSSRYAPEQAVGHLLAAPRYPSFPVVWITMIFALSGIVTVLYASVRTACGAGPKTALAVGVMVGFAAGFPGNFATATWSPVDRFLPLFWMIEMWGGAILAALTAGWLYRD
jgi:hypothetical protein